MNMIRRGGILKMKKKRKKKKKGKNSRCRVTQVTM